MTQTISSKKSIPQANRYQKSSRKKVAKLQYSPKGFKAEFEEADYFAIGDSFVNMFLHAANVFFIKLKGKSIKGLVKLQKQQRKQIEKWVSAMPPNCQVIFNFGQVDLNLVRYYKLAHKETYPDETFQQYVEFLGSLSRKVIILGILKSSIKRQHIADVLAKYGTLQGVSIEKDLILQEHAKTEEIRRKWNGLMQEACPRHGVKFVDLFDYENELDPKFIDQNPQTIHLRYLPTIIELNKQLPRLKIDIKRSLQIEEEYVTQKTERYRTNLEILQDRKKLESGQSQDTRTENNSEIGGAEEESEMMEISDDEDSNKNHVNRKKSTDNRISKDSKLVVNMEKMPKINSDHQSEINNQLTNGNHTKDNLFIELLIIPGVKTIEQLFSRLHQPQNQKFLSIISYQIVRKGMAWLSNLGSNDLVNNVLCLLKDVFVEFGDDKKGAERFTEKFVTCLQQLFEEELINERDEKRHDTDLQKVINFILLLYTKQQEYQFTIVKDKIIRRLIAEIVSSLFVLSIAENTSTEKIISLTGYLRNIMTRIGCKMDELLKINLKKKKITEDQLYKRFLEAVPFGDLHNNTNVQKQHKDFQQFFEQQCSYAVYSRKILSVLVLRAEMKKQFQYFWQKLKIAQKNSIVTTSNQRAKVQKKLGELSKDYDEKINKLEGEFKEKKDIVESNHFCKCGKCGYLEKELKKSM